MNIFNRALTILLLLGLAIISGLSILQPLGTVDLLRSALDALPGFVSLNVLVYRVVFAALLFVILLLLILEVRRPQRRTVKVLQATGGVVELTTESVARSLEYRVAQLPGITQVRPVVISAGNSVRVTLDLETIPEADVPAKSEEIMQVTREVIENRLGLKLPARALRVNIRHAPFGKAMAGTLASGPGDVADDLPKGAL